MLFLDRNFRDNVCCVRSFGDLFVCLQLVGSTRLGNGLTLVPSSFGLVIFLQSQPELSWVSVITLLADRFQVNLIKFGLDSHLLVTRAAGEVVNTPSLVQGSKHVRLDNLVADIAEVPKQLMVMGLTVSKTLPFIMPVSKERLLTLGTNEMFHMPVFTKSCHDSLFNWSPACPTDRDAHLVVAAQAVQLIQLLGCVPRPGAHLSCCTGEFYFTARAVEMIRVEGLTTVPQRFPLDSTMALLTHVLSLSSSPHLSVTLMT